MKHFRLYVAFIFSAIILGVHIPKLLADPPRRVADQGPSIATVKAEAPIKQTEPIKQPEIATVAEIQPVNNAPKPQAVSTPSPEPAAAPAPPTSSGGCVTGYSTGDVYLNKIIAYESGGRSCATNPGGCFGLLQACPGAPLRAACGGDPECQIAWFRANKTNGRSWAQVWQHEEQYGYW